jgi:hypothetical protein
VEHKPSVDGSLKSMKPHSQGSEAGRRPVRQPKPLQLVINLETAKQLGGTIPISAHRCRRGDAADAEGRLWHKGEASGAAAI